MAPLFFCIYHLRTGKEPSAEVESKGNREAEVELSRHEIKTDSYITIAQLLDEFLSSTNTLLDKQSVQYGQLLQDVAHAHLRVVLETGNG